MAKGKTKGVKETPLMKQYNAIKRNSPDAILLFRVGDFYETFGEDAIKTANTLGIVLTKRHNGSAGEVELAGFPHHSLDSYLPKLVRSGFRVAVCDQLEDPKQTKGIVKRGITELVTPGLTYSGDVLSGASNNYLGSVYYLKGQIGIAFLDISTGEFLVGQGNEFEVQKQLQSFDPSELLYTKSQRNQLYSSLGSVENGFALDDWVFSEEFAQEKLLKHFGTSSLKGFGVEDLDIGIVAAGAILEYLDITKNSQLDHVSTISRIESDQYVWLDKFTIRNLELVNTPFQGGMSLIQILDSCETSMGSRCLRKWLLWPLKERKSIHKRQDLAGEIIENESAREKISEALNSVGDIERLISRIGSGRLSPRDVSALKNSLTGIEALKSALKILGKAASSYSEELDPCSSLLERISHELHDEVSNALGKGKVIADGVNADLDELRKLQSEGKNYLLELQRKQSEATGITSLKVAYNNVFGYYIEVRNTHKDRVPEEWIRKQTLVNAERYITQELKEYEEKILGAEEKINILERELFEGLVEEIRPFVQKIQINARQAAECDCILSFSRNALAFGYTKPEINDSTTIDIKEGRHPVIERQMEIGESYIANDVYLDTDGQQIMMITGPNMSGKSALLRQTALITLMAQMGSYVPAKSAKIGIVDKIFTRVGASDNISKGESTFMVEMHETASILNNLSDRSLILLDEIGRGTSTFDGISIAWSIAEYLHENGKFKPKTLFATHYHELNDMSSRFKRIKNYHVSIKELQDDIIFLRKLKPGGSEHSFGIHVASMAGMPGKLVRRAGEIMKQLESTHLQGNITDQGEETAMQMSIFQLDDPVLEQIRDELTSLDINNLTPVEALMKLNEIKKWVGGKDKKPEK